MVRAPKVPLPKGRAPPEGLNTKEKTVVHRSKKYTILAGAGLATALTLSACGSSDNGSTGSMGGMDHGTVSTGTPATSGSAASRPGDVMFAQMMIPHHQQAIELADLALKDSSASAPVTELARQIKGAQDPEIETMNSWLREWNAPAPSSMGHGTSDGMMSDDDMDALGTAKGPDFDRMWLTMMVRHHQGAIAMAQDVLKTSTDTRVKTLAQAIVEGQNKEIATMRGML